MNNINLLNKTHPNKKIIQDKWVQYTVNYV